MLYGWYWKATMASRELLSRSKVKWVKHFVHENEGERLEMERKKTTINQKNILKCARIWWNVSFFPICIGPLSLSFLALSFIAGPESFVFQKASTCWLRLSTPKYSRRLSGRVWQRAGPNHSDLDYWRVCWRRRNIRDEMRQELLHEKSEKNMEFRTSLSAAADSMSIYNRIVNVRDDWLIWSSTFRYGRPDKHVVVGISLISIVDLD